jgi:hypothetical protein
LATLFSPLSVDFVSSSQQLLFQWIICDVGNYSRNMECILPFFTRRIPFRIKSASRTSLYSPSVFHEWCLTVMSVSPKKTAWMNTGTLLSR